MILCRIVILHEIAWDLMSKHRSCHLHVAAYVKHREKKITLREATEIKKRYNLTLPCFFQAFPRRKRSKQMTNKEISTHGKKEKLDTGIFEQYMESLWKSFSEDQKTQCAYLDSLWFSLYRKASNRPKVLTWIKQKRILSKKYVFVPIVCWNHWSLLIFVHLGEGLNSENGTPCMLLLDSLEGADPRRLEPEIRKFVVDIYREEGRKEDKKAVSQIPFLIPKVPQQRDDTECGNYVLYYIKLFIESAPEKFSISKDYPYFMTRDWFDPKSVEHFRSKLEKKQSKKMLMTKSSSILRLQTLRRTGSVISLDD